tara:strand:- start:306 stop:527 length:222 start_codon:yes stop_codon:yes gene_type:complete
MVKKKGATANWKDVDGNPLEPPLPIEKPPTPKRGRIERWLDRHNHKMEFLRTLVGVLTISLQIIILLKIFNFI